MNFALILFLLTLVSGVLLVTLPGADPVWTARARTVVVADTGSDVRDVYMQSFLSRGDRLRSAIATARLAEFWPTMWRSSSETISWGVIWDMVRVFRGRRMTDDFAAARLH